MSNASQFRISQHVLITLAVIVVVIAGFAGYWLYSKRSSTPTIEARMPGAEVGIYRAETWLIDSNNNGQLDIPGDRSFSFKGTTPEDIPVVGDWNGDGRMKAGLYRNGTWYLDLNGDGVLDLTGGTDLILHFGGVAGDVPVVGDWNGDGKDKIGIFRQQFLWMLDVNGDGVFKEGVDPVFPFGGVPGDQPVIGHWDGKRASQVGIYRNGTWILDQDGDRKHTPADPVYHFGGVPNDVPTPGDWIGDGRTRLGIYRQGLWILDKNGDGHIDEGSGIDRIFPFGGLAGDRPVAGNW